jgi:hypothetical protein
MVATCGDRSEFFLGKRRGISVPYGIIFLLFKKSAYSSGYVGDGKLLDALNIRLGPIRVILAQNSSEFLC